MKPTPSSMFFFSETKCHLGHVVKEPTLTERTYIYHVLAQPSFSHVIVLVTSHDPMQQKDLSKSVKGNSCMRKDL
jgi:hypothetical protein